MTNFISWIFSRWYFWGFVIIHFLYTTPKVALPIMSYAKVLGISFLKIFIIFLAIRFFFFILGKVFVNKNRRY